MTYLCSNRHVGKFTRREDLANRLYTTKQDDLGLEKQRRPLEDERRLEESGDDRIRGNESDSSHQELLPVLKREHFLMD